ncbi:MAG: lysine--tRNA ligase [Gammaproteobacteria bacterium RIFCSPHIGHO2_02_FULL_39_13]|nr:MAG: lysine--tRNA ligase [Gammaproteobacteria bacterium RIFCSPHIGHO2_02_FULL_39_13]OGT48167.1 MAG: lysine--tRNA ligase [Gammaproteobacteria bacterium RIFCSPHIGHO2_12_FULL_39_24]
MSEKNTSENPAPENQLDENEQINQRKSKLKEMRARGIAYPNDFVRDTLAQDIHQNYDLFDHDALVEKNIRVTVAGRMMTRRVMGKASFVHLQDMSGKIQLYIARDHLPEGIYEQFKHWDLGDIVGASGIIFKTKTNELSIKVDQLRILTKALRPLPDKYHGLADQEQRFRQRYVDLMVNEDARRIFHIRSKMVAEIRRFLDAHHFVEVETPMMQVQAGGAIAKPFKTHHNAMDMELFLRIAPELYLKRLVVGGFEKVYEINRNFRNEGISTRHNPEFTMLEFYQAYATYHDLMDLTEKLFCQLAENVLGQAHLTYQGTQIDFSKPFARMTMKESIMQKQPDITEKQLDNLDAAKKLAQQFKIDLLPTMQLGAVQLALFEKWVERELKQPTFITDYPAEVSPLARANDKNPFITDRFEFFCGGQEIANGFSELNDPEDQANRFHAQLKARDAGDHEAMPFDQDYINALEYGLPPTAGEGIGIDRLVMLFADCASIRDVILFPLLRQKI